VHASAVERKLTISANRISLFVSMCLARGDFSRVRAVSISRFRIYASEGITLTGDAMKGISSCWFAKYD
jgi:hypothetical protein